MCIDFNIAAAVPIPNIPDGRDTISTHELHPTHPVNAKFSLPYRKNLGSHIGCGCGYIYADWDEEMVIPRDQVVPVYGEGEEMHIDYGGSIVVEILEDEPNPSHVQLAELIRGLLRESEFVELYGCWEHQWREPTAKVEWITPDDLVKKDFYFYHYYLYRVTAEPVL